MPYADPQRILDYQKAYREKHRERLNREAKVRRDSDPHYTGRTNRLHRLALRNVRREIIKRLGSKCLDCGITDERVFQLHHVNGDGNIKRKNGTSKGYTISYYKTMLAELDVDPSCILLLCANCHAIRHWKGDNDYTLKVQK